MQDSTNIGVTVQTSQSEQKTVSRQTDILSTLGNDNQQGSAITAHANGSHTSNGSRSPRARTTQTLGMVSETMYARNEARMDPIDLAVVEEYANEDFLARKHATTLAIENMPSNLHYQLRDCQRLEDDEAMEDLYQRLKAVTEGMMKLPQPRPRVCGRDGC